MITQLDVAVSEIEILFGANFLEMKAGLDIGRCDLGLSRLLISKTVVSYSVVWISLAS